LWGMNHTKWNEEKGGSSLSDWVGLYEDFIRTSSLPAAKSTEDRLVKAR
jgi:hypothetical protein